jgi:hypothetical protein
MRLVAWHPLRRGSLVGFAGIELRSGLIVQDCPVCASHERVWASLPSKPLLGPDGMALRDDSGRIRYAAILKWRDRALADRWSAAVVALVRAEHPGDLDDKGAT